MMAEFLRKAQQARKSIQNADVSVQGDTDWEELIDGAFQMMAIRCGGTKWDILADFMRTLLEEE